MSFINDSGVIIDDSLSPARRWLKENLLIEQYAEIIRFTGIADDARQRIEYVFIDESAAIAEYNVLYGYLEDYGGGGGGGGTPLEIEQDGVSVETDTHKINVLPPLEAVSVGGNEVELRLATSALTGAMYERLSFQILQRPYKFRYVSAVNKIYVPSRTSQNITIYDADTYEVLATIASVLGGITWIVGCNYISSLSEVWTANITTGLITRINATTNAVAGTIAQGTQGKNTFLEYLNPATGNDRIYMVIACTFASPSGSCVVMYDIVAAAFTVIALTTGTACSDGVIIRNPASAMDGCLVIAGTNGLYVIDCETNTVLATAVTPTGLSGNPNGIDYHFASDRLVVNYPATNIVAILTPLTTTTFTVEHLVRSVYNPNTGVEVDQANGIALVGANTRPVLFSVLQKIDIANGVSINQLTLSTRTSAANHISIRGNGEAYVAGDDSANVSTMSLVKYT